MRSLVEAPVDYFIDAVTEESPEGGLLVLLARARGRIDLVDLFQVSCLDLKARRLTTKAVKMSNL